MLKRILTVSVVVMTIVWAVGLAAFVPVAQAAVVSGDLIKASQTTVYYMGADGYRYVFPDEKTYFTWYPDWSGVKTITDAELAAIPMKSLTGNVTYRPGVKLIKITTDPKVYAVAANGTLRWITTADIAVCLYGANWGALVQDVPDSFFVNYTTGAAINACADYSPAAATAAATSINVDKGLTGGVIVPLVGDLTVSLASDTPGNQTVPEGATGVVASIINLSAGSNAITLNSLTIKRTNLGDPLEISKVYLYEGVNKLTTGKTINATSNEVLFANLNKVIAANSTLKLSIVVDINPAATTDGMHQFGIASASAVSSTAASVGGAFPVYGNILTLSSITVGKADVESNGADYTRKVGEIGVEVGNFSVSVSNKEDATFNGITLYNSDRAVLSNLKLYRGSDLMATATQSGDYFVFVLATPYSILKGSSVSFIVKGDIGGQDGDTATLNVRYSTDVKVKGVTYGYNLTIDVAEGTDPANSYVEEVDATASSNTTTVQAGQLTAAVSGPATGNISKNSNDAILLNFSLTAQSALDVEKASVKLSGNASLSATDIQNLELVCDNQVVASTAAPKVDAVGVDDDGIGGVDSAAEGVNIFTDVWQLTAGKVTSCFIRVDITNTAAGTENIKATLLDLKDAAYWVFKDSSTGDTITDVVPSGAIAGNTMSVISASLSIQLAGNPASGSTYVRGSTNVSTAGFVFTAGTAADIKVNSVKLTAYLDDTTLTGWAGTDKDETSNANDIMSAIRIYDSANLATPLATAKSLTVNANDITVSFDSLNWIIAKGVSKTLLVKVDLSTTAPFNGDDDKFAIAIAGAGDVSAEYGSGSTITPNLTNGNTTPTVFQIVTTAGTLSMQTDSTTPLSALVAMGLNNVVFTRVRFTSTKEAFTVSDLRVYNPVAGTDDNFSGITLSYQDSTGTTQTTAPVSLNNGYANFSGLSLYVPSGSSSVLTIRANINTAIDGADNGDAPSLQVVQNGKFTANTLTNVTYVTTVLPGNNDVGTTVVAITNFDITGGDANWAPTECIYIAAAGTVAIADTRVTDCGSYLAGSTVAALDSDIGTVVTAATNLSGPNATWVAGNAAYIAVPGNIAAGDTRVVYSAGGNPMTIYESYPTVVIPQNIPASGTIVPSVHTLIGEIDITAGAANSITFKQALGNQIVLKLATASLTLGNVTLEGSGTTWCTMAAAASMTCNFSAGTYEIAAGGTGKLSVYADTSLMVQGESLQLWLDDAADANISWSIAGVGNYQEGALVFAGDKYGIPMSYPN